MHKMTARHTVSPWSYVLLVITALVILSTPVLALRTAIREDQDDSASMLDTNIVLAMVSCGTDNQRDLTISVFQGYMMFADFDHTYTFILFTDNKREWLPVFEEAKRNFTRNEPRLKVQLTLLDVETSSDDKVSNQFRRCAGYRITPGFYRRLYDRGYNRVIYLDADTMILDNMYELWRLWENMEGKTFGFVSEVNIAKGWYVQQVRLGKIKQAHVLGPFGINSGVMLWDTNLTMQNSFPVVLEDIMARHYLQMFDQDALSISCTDPKYAGIECVLLPCRWNYRYVDHQGDCLSEQQQGIGVFHGNRGKLPGKAELHDEFAIGINSHPASLFWGTFPCFDRLHCLERLEAELNFLTSAPYEGRSWCNSYNVEFRGPYKGTEFDFANETNSTRTNAHPNDISCRVLFNVRDTLEWSRRAITA